MDCGSCAESVEKALRTLDGVEDVHADVVGGRVSVRYVEGKLGRGDLVGAITRLGYRVEDGSAHGEVFEVEGMDCADEVRLLEAKLGGLPGVARLGFDLVRRRLTVEGTASPVEVERAVVQLGMRARLVGETHGEATWWDRHERLLLTGLAGALWAASLAAGHLFRATTVSEVLAVVALVVAGRYIVPRGVRAAMNSALDMNFLMSVAAVGALAIGQYEEAASAMVLFAVAQLLETYSMDRARNAIRRLMDLSPAEATVLRGGRERRVPVDQVEVGETVVVRPGERVPVDGEVLRGRSAVNQAPITGESVPVEKAAGAEVFAGTLNGEGALEVRSTKPAADTTLARILAAVEEAQASRAPSQAFVDRFARVYTPLVVGSAVLLVLLPPLLGFGTWSEWFYRSLVLLVVACPCALVISTPVTVVSALAGAARQGVLIKGGLYLEAAGRARMVAFDKTGTLTEGRPAVAEVVGLDGATPREVLALAAAAEARSEHPLARAILERAAEEGIAAPAAPVSSAIPGRGVRAELGEEIVAVGSGRLFDELGAGGPEVTRARDRLEAAGQTVVLVGSGPAMSADAPPTVRGAIGIVDRVRAGAPEALGALRRAGIGRIVVLTGDNAGTAGAVADTLAGRGGRIDEVRAGLLPEDKTRAVEALRERYGSVLFVGDGINDAPALAAADVGVAMGAAGTDVALEVADIALMADDLSRLPVAIRLARKAEGIIRANIAVSLLTKAIFVVLALAGVATLWMAVLTDMGTSLLVVLNGLRALRE